MNRRRTITTAALAVTLALPAAAGAQDTTEKDCLKFDSKDKAPLTFEFEGNTLTLEPREGDATELLRVKTSKRGKVKLTRDGNAYSFDLPKEEGETFTVTKRKSGTGKLRLRVNVLDAEGDRLTRFEIRVKAFDEVVCESDEAEAEADEDEKSDDDKGEKNDDGDKSDDKGEKDDESGDDKGDKGDEGDEGDDEDKSRGRGRGPESEEDRKSRVERGEGRGPETEEEREERTDGDDG